MKTSQFNELEMFLFFILGNQNEGWVKIAFFGLGIFSFLQGLVNASRDN